MDPQTSMHSSSQYAAYRYDHYCLPYPGREVIDKIKSLRKMITAGDPRSWQGLLLSAEELQQAQITLQVAQIDQKALRDICEELKKDIVLLYEEMLAILATQIPQQDDQEQAKQKFSSRLKQIHETALSETSRHPISQGLLKSLFKTIYCSSKLLWKFSKTTTDTFFSSLRSHYYLLIVSGLALPSKAWYSGSIATPSEFACSRSWPSFLSTYACSILMLYGLTYSLSKFYSSLGLTACKSLLAKMSDQEQSTVLSIAKSVLAKTKNPDAILQFRPIEGKCTAFIEIEHVKINEHMHAIPSIHMNLAELLKPPISKTAPQCISGIPRLEEAIIHEIGHLENGDIQSENHHGHLIGSIFAAIALSYGLQCILELLSSSDARPCGSHINALTTSIMTAILAFYFYAEWRREIERRADDFAGRHASLEAVSASMINFLELHMRWKKMGWMLRILDPFHPPEIERATILGYHYNRRVSEDIESEDRPKKLK